MLSDSTFFNTRQTIIIKNNFKYKEMKKRKNLLLILIGPIIISVSRIVGHYLTIPDLVSGFLIGAGIGLTIFSLLRQKLRPNC